MHADRGAFGKYDNPLALLNDERLISGESDCVYALMTDCDLSI